MRFGNEEDQFLAREILRNDINQTEDEKKSLYAAFDLLEKGNEEDKDIARPYLQCIIENPADKYWMDVYMTLRDSTDEIYQASIQNIIPSLFENTEFKYTSCVINDFWCSANKEKKEFAREVLYKITQNTLHPQFVRAIETLQQSDQEQDKTVALQSLTTILQDINHPHLFYAINTMNRSYQKTDKVFAYKAFISALESGEHLEEAADFAKNNNYFISNVADYVAEFGTPENMRPLFLHATELNIDKNIIRNAFNIAIRNNRLEMIICFTEYNKNIISEIIKDSLYDIYTYIDNDELITKLTQILIESDQGIELNQYAIDDACRIAAEREMTTALSYIISPRTGIMPTQHALKFALETSISTRKLKSIQCLVENSQELKSDIIDGILWGITSFNFDEQNDENDEKIEIIRYLASPRSGIMPSDETLKSLLKYSIEKQNLKVIKCLIENSSTFDERL